MTTDKDFGIKKRYGDKRNINRFQNLFRFSASESPR